MDKYLKSRLDSKLLTLAGHLGGICRRKKINVIDKDNFVLNNRKLILDYHTLTGDYTNFVKNMIHGSAVLDEEQLGRYQSKSFGRACGGEFSEAGFLYTDID